MQPIRVAIRAIFADLDQRLRAQHELPAPTRTPLLDPSTTLLAGDLVLVGAHRTDYAEYLLNTIALDVAPARDVLIVSHDPHAIVCQLLHIMTGVDLAQGGDKLTRAEIVRAQKAAETLQQQRVSIVDAVVYRGRPERVANWLADHPGGIAIVVSAWPASFGRDEEEAAEFVRTLKAIARETCGTVVIPWRVHDRGRGDPRPVLQDLAVSGAAEDDADLVVLFHTSEYGVEVILAKNRHGPTGYVWNSPEYPGRVM